MTLVFEAASGDEDGQIRIVVRGGVTEVARVKNHSAIQEIMVALLAFLDLYKTPLPDGAQYRMKISAANLMIPPTVNALR